MNDVEVVKMTAEHVDDIMVIEKLSFTIPWSRDAFIEEVTNNKFARYLCAKINDKVIGYAGFWKVCDEGHITNIAVHPEFRNNKVGSILMERLLEMAKKEGVSAVTLEVRISNIPAQNLYKKYGFKVMGIRKGYYADNGEDALIMWKHIM